MTISNTIKATANARFPFGDLSELGQERRAGGRAQQQESHAQRFFESQQPGKQYGARRHQHKIRQYRQQHQAQIAQRSRDLGDFES
jgi:hypothetical protein